MKRRTVQTYKILAVALTTAGCSSAVGGEAAKPVAVAEAPASVEPGAAAAVIPQVARRPESSDPALIALAVALKTMKRDEVLANPARFQPLCDKDGYPLVGNLVGKGETPKYSASAFCEDMRAQAKR